ncbi:MAG: hypothetical protein AMJ95_02355 [Omnitrophica WOR_2 bacterium SM23_72]|nr:MAG: hypothetical protein AMJ95_02355 [Omnitrophica WOR_2 bacterium SM23_72]
MLNFLRKNYYRLLYKSVEPGGKIQDCFRRACFKLLNIYRNKDRAIKLQVTNKCNLRCKDCYCQFEKDSSLEKVEICNLLDQLKKLRYKNLSLHILGGEPLLRSDILEIISYAKKQAKLKQILLFTNGTFITNRLAREMEQSGLDAAIVTLHSHREEIHDSMTQSNGSWDKAVSGIKFLINSGIPTYSFTVFMSCNVGHLREIENFVKHLGAKTLYLPYIKQKENDSLCVGNQYEFQRAIEWTFNKSNRHKRILLEMLLTRGKSCSAFVHHINIKSDGTVTPCPFLNLNLGNIKEEKIYSILNRSYKNKELLDFLSTPQECKGCSLVNICGGGCKAFRYNIYHDAKNKDENCAGPHKERISLEELGSYMPYLL